MSDLQIYVYFTLVFGWNEIKIEKQAWNVPLYNPDTQCASSQWKKWLYELSHNRAHTRTRTQSERSVWDTSSTVGSKVKLEGLWGVKVDRDAETQGCCSTSSLTHKEDV